MKSTALSLGKGLDKTGIFQDYMFTHNITKYTSSTEFGCAGCVSNVRVDAFHRGPNLTWLNFCQAFIRTLCSNVWILFW